MSCPAQAVRLRIARHPNVGSYHADSRLSFPGQDPGGNYLQYASVHMMPEAIGPVQHAAHQLYSREAIREYHVVVLVGHVVHCIVQCRQFTSEGCIEVCRMACAPGCPMRCLPSTMVTRAVASCCNKLVLLLWLKEM